MVGASMIILQGMPEKTKSRYLMPGDKVGLICPASPITQEKLDKAIDNLKSIGLIPVPGRHILDQAGYLAGKDQDRLSDLHEMYRDDTIKAIWCIRGGYGCTHLLPDLDLDLIRTHPKLLIGYSDVTALHLALYTEAGQHNLHGPVASSDFTTYSVDMLRKVIFGSSGQSFQIKPCEENDALSAEGKTTFDRFVINDGQARGHLWGGNLSLLSAMSGTKYLKMKQDTLLFLEDIEESPYRIDRMLTQMFQALPLSKIKGVIVGVCEGCEKKPDSNSFTLREVMMDRIAKLKVPAVYGFPIGHIANQCTLPIGASAILNTSDFSLEVRLP